MNYHQSFFSSDSSQSNNGYCSEITLPDFEDKNKSYTIIDEKNHRRNGSIISRSSFMSTINNDIFLNNTSWFSSSSSFRNLWTINENDNNDDDTFTTTHTAQQQQNPKMNITTTEVPLSTTDNTTTTTTDDDFIYNINNIVVDNNEVGQEEEEEEAKEQQEYDGNDNDEEDHNNVMSFFASSFRNLWTMNDDTPTQQNATKKQRVEAATDGCREEESKVHDYDDYYDQEVHYNNDQDQDQENYAMPTFSTNPKFMEALLSSRLNQISLEERSDAIFDLHGIKQQKHDNDNNNIVQQQQQREKNENEESPNFISGKIHEFNSTTLNLMAKLNPDDTHAYRLAMSMDPDYVDSLKLMFLRSELYKPYKASERLIKFFQLKYDWFGIDLLTEDITFDDLSIEEYDVLHQGYIQLLPKLDRAGRAIVFIHGPTGTKFTNNLSVVKALFVFAMSLMKDNYYNSQMNGIVGIWYGIGQNKVMNGRMPMIVELGKALPLRLVGRHSCRSKSEGGFYGSVMEYFIRNIHGKQLAGLKFHFGTPLECYYNLMTFGIPKDALPTIIINEEEDGSSSVIDLTNHHEMLQFLKNRQQQEQQQQQQENQQQSSPQQAQQRILQDDNVELLPPPPVTNMVTEGFVAASTITNPLPPPQFAPPPVADDVVGPRNDNIILPQPMDVLMGKGQQPNKRPGLLKMHNLLLKYNEKYNTAARLDKSKVCRLVLQEMEQDGCRFLTKKAKSTSQGKGGYVECTESQALEKISHGFRNLKQKQKKKKERQQKNQNQKKDVGSSSVVVQGNDDDDDVTMSGTNKKKRNLEEAL